MAKYLRPEDVAALEETLQNVLSWMEENGKHHTNKAAYESIGKSFGEFSDKSNTADVLENCAAAVASVSTDWAQAIANIVATGIRAMNYPGHWNQAQTTPRDAYRSGNPGPAIKGGASWVCPRPYGSPLTPHPAALGDCTIEHIQPVVWHWNNYGRNQTKVQRKAWCHSTANHEYLCQSCNSSKSGGGLTYIIATGPNYSN
ncbi:MAG: hypothetical protein ACJAS1_004120 [Oleiphilaceae bacterium]|jgi:hypothetical protein